MKGAEGPEADVPAGVAEADQDEIPATEKKISKLKLFAILTVWKEKASTINCRFNLFLNNFYCPFN